VTGAPQDQPVIDWGSASSALDGMESGDTHVVAPFPNGVLLAVIDGLGHGTEAAAAAQQAAQILSANAGEAVLSLVQRCHEGLRKTRGAVMSVASLNAQDSSVTWVGIGNVEGVLLRADRTANPSREAINLRGGIVGYQLPPLQPATVALSRGDTLIMVTDGIDSGFMTGLAVEHAPQTLADFILTQHARGTDDALVLVARYSGGRT